MKIKYSLIKQRKHIQGFTIIEIMIAMLLGLLLTTGVTKVYLTTKETYNLSENLSRLQESARFAMRYLTEDIRMAGFMPCRMTANMANTLNSTESYLDFFNRALIGYEGGVSVFPAGFPATGTNPGDRVAGTDAIVILRGDDEIYKVTQHNPVSAQFKLNDLHTMGDGDVVMICDGTDSAVFQVTNVNSSNVTVVHNTGTGTPGNCSKFLGGNGNCSDTTNLVAHTYGPGSQLVKFKAVGYYIGVSASGTSRSLYRRRLNIDNSTTSIGFATEELLDGIENLQLLYGEDTDGDNEPEQYFTANNVTTWNNVVAVKAGILAHTPDQINKINDTNSYNVAGTQIADTGTPVLHDGDQRLRNVFTSTVKVRNRGLN
jgi:type IV pilus assembly protein PilW